MGTKVPRALPVSPVSPLLSDPLTSLGQSRGDTPQHAAPSSGCACLLAVQHPSTCQQSLPAADRYASNPQLLLLLRPEHPRRPRPRYTMSFIAYLFLISGGGTPPGGRGGVRPAGIGNGEKKKVKVGPSESESESESGPGSAASEWVRADGNGK